MLQRAVRPGDPETARASFQTPSRRLIAGNNSAGLAVAAGVAMALWCCVELRDAPRPSYASARPFAVAGQRHERKHWLREQTQLTKAACSVLGALIVDGFQPAGSGDAFRGPPFHCSSVPTLFPTLRPPASRGMDLGWTWDGHGMDVGCRASAGGEGAVRQTKASPFLSIQTKQS